MRVLTLESDWGALKRMNSNISILQRLLILVLFEEVILDVGE